MRDEIEYGKLHVKDGWIVCPRCGRQMHGIRILPETVAKETELFCRSCKSKFIVNIDSGQRVYRQRP